MHLTSSNFFGLPVTKVSVFLAILDVILTRGGVYVLSADFDIWALIYSSMRELLGVLVCFAAATVALYAVAASLVREG